MFRGKSKDRFANFILACIFLIPVSMILHEITDVAFFAYIWTIGPALWLIYYVYFIVYHIAKERHRFAIPLFVAIVLVVSGLTFLLFRFPTAAPPPPRYIASINSEKYHLTSCDLSYNILPENTVTYKTATDAEDDGMGPCLTCNPDRPISDSTATVQATVKTPTSYVASINSDKYHIQSCDFAHNILAGNRVYYKSISAATAADKSPCSKCTPNK